MQAAAAAILVVHLAWILWAIFGALFTRGRPFLTAFHVASLIWGIIVEIGPWPCPLTLAEQFFDPYQGGFLVHYLDAIVYPNVPESVLVYAGVGVCAFNLLVYVRRFVKQR